MLLSSLELIDSNLNRYYLMISIRCYYLVSDQVDIFEKYQKLLNSCSMCTYLFLT